MTEQELNEFLQNSPTLYHVAEFGSWSSIEERGLLSTTAILDAYGIDGEERRKIEEERRSTNKTLTHKTLPNIVVRDQRSMSDSALERCLLDGLTIREWYLLLNSKVFFWPSKKRLSSFLNAQAYRNRKHDVIVVDSSALVMNYRDKISLSPINSGSTLYKPQPRGRGTFYRIPEYPYAARPTANRVAELAVDYGIPNIVDYVVGGV